MDPKKIEKMVKDSFEKGDADKDWESRESDKNLDKVSNEPDPANDLPPVD